METKEIKMASDKQVKFVQDLCEQKGLKYTEAMTISSAVAHASIGKLTAMPSVAKVVESNNLAVDKPLTDKQIAKIKELSEQLGVAEPDYTKLDGKYGGTGSQKIKELMEMAKDNNIIAPISEKQAEYILKMQSCPDVIAVEGVSMTEEDIAKLNRTDASAYISKNNSAFIAWDMDKPSDEQISYIEKLHEALETPFDLQGIKCLRRANVSAYITQLTKELNDKIWNETSLEPEEMRGIKTDTEGKPDYDENAEALKTFCHHMFGLVGEGIDDDFSGTFDFNSIDQLVIEVRDFLTHKVKGKFVIDSKEYIESLIEDCKAFDADRQDELKGLLNIG